MKELLLNETEIKSIRLMLAAATSAINYSNKKASKASAIKFLEVIEYRLNNAKTVNKGPAQ